MDRMKWSWHELRSTPKHSIEKLLFLWHLQAIADDAANPPDKK